MSTQLLLDMLCPHSYTREEFKATNPSLPTIENYKSLLSLETTYYLLWAQFVTPFKDGAGWLVQPLSCLYNSRSSAKPLHTHNCLHEFLNSNLNEIYHIDALTKQPENSWLGIQLNNTSILITLVTSLQTLFII